MGEGQGYHMQVSLNEFGWEAVSALSAIVLAIFGYLISRRLRMANEKTEKFALLSEFRKEIVGYSSQFFELTSIAITHCAVSDSASVEDAQRTANALSALADTGRFLFPNYVDGSGYGREKGPAFEGYRREPLDAVLAAFHALQAIEHPERCEQFLRLSKHLLEIAGQPLSKEFDPTSPRSHIIEARRSYLNSVVPSTFPREWLSQFSELYKPVSAKQQ